MSTKIRKIENGIPLNGIPAWQKPPSKQPKGTFYHAKDGL